MRLYKSYPVEIDYGMSIEDALKAGKFFSVDEVINSVNFPPTRRGKTSIMIDLFQFNSWVTTTSVKTKFESNGYRAAEMIEFIALANQHPEAAGEHAVAALGSRCMKNGRCVVPDLVNLPQRGPDISVSMYSTTWKTGWLFAAVKK